MIPYQILNVPYGADSQTIRTAYQRAIKKFPPETSPEQFKMINAAYHSIKDLDSRLLRETGADVKAGQEFSSLLDATTDFLRADLLPQPPTKDAFLNFLSTQ